MRSHQSVIAAFGGLSQMARAIGIPTSRTCHFARRGIPARYWPAIEIAAGERGILITAVGMMQLPVKCDPATCPNSHLAARQAA